MIARPLALAVALIAAPASAQIPKIEMEAIAAPSDPAAIPLRPTSPGAASEDWAKVTMALPDGGRSVDRMARNVTAATITPVLPDPGNATGAAVVVAPGGAFMALSMDNEGFSVARWLAAHGIAAFVLKYRLNATPRDQASFERAIGERMRRTIAQGGATDDVGEPRAYVDALRALELVRNDATRWRIDPTRVGILGFSAGAMTSLQSVLMGKPADRPAFIGYIYGPMKAIDVPTGAPPMFAALALNDPLFGRQGFGIVDAWRKAGAPIELHAYQRGDHGFGMGRPGTTTTLVMDEFRLWLDANGFLRGKR